MTPDEARSLGRAIRAIRTERGLSQIKVAFTIGIGVGQLGIWGRGKVPAARGRAEHPPAITCDQLAALAAALDCTVADIANRAARTVAARVLYGLEPLGPGRTIVGGREFDLADADADADRVTDFIAGLTAGRELQQ